MTAVIGQSNSAIGSVSGSNFTDIIESLQNYDAPLTTMGQAIDIDPFKSETHTIRNWDRLKLSDKMMLPLNPHIYNSEKIISMSGSKITLNPSEYGITLIVSERARMNSPEDMVRAASTLISDYSMQFKENFAVNALAGANRVFFEFSQGGAGTPRKANIDDFCDLSTMMEQNGATPAVEFMRATDQTRSTPVGKSYVFVTSVKGAGAIKRNLKADEFFMVHRYAGISDYPLASKGSIDKANIEVYVSSAMRQGSKTGRTGLLLGNQPFYKTGRTPITSRVIVSPASDSNYAYHTKIQYVISYDIALSANNRIIKALFAD